MARKPRVTRTITSTKVNVLCLNLTTCEPHNVDFELAGTYKNEGEILKAVADLIDTDEKAVHVTSTETVEKVYGMSEQDFITHADELDENRKPIIKEVAGETENKESETVEQ